MKMRIGYVLILASSLLYSASAQCSEWKYLNSSSWDKRFFDVYEEPFAITDIKIVRQKTVYNEITVQKVIEANGYRYRDFTESVHIFAIDCIEKRFQLKAVFYYDSNGNVIDSLLYQNTVYWASIKARALLDLLYGKACSVDNEKAP